MPSPTPLLAAAPGSVTRSGAVFVILYSHVSRVDVDIGNVVSAGQQVALSGNTGCSTGPHLHFEVQYQSRTAAPSAAGALPVVAERGVPFDPFGWEGAGPDPWARSPLGTASQWLWLEGAAPAGTP
ncbi:MAG: M23 family metallopeptidase [Gemmatimonadota bacterium]|nr:M23 family metallopeptidase [Gemmatimonadota bacterium]MDH3421634.1 M23 family metallopeptidase [Gemmatimonadota bacterium]